MKVNKWTVGLAAAGLVTLSPALLAQTPAPASAPALTPVLTALSATTISGYVDTSAVWNPGTGNANPAPFAFNTPDKRDGFNLDAVDIKISKAQDETGWSAGYTAELNYGPDAKAIDNGVGTGTYPIRQAFVALHMPVGNGIDWQIGRWDNLLGYESSDSYKNPNFTRSYGYTFEPTEHTGLLGSYKFSDSTNLQAGVADTVTTAGVNDRSDPGSVAVETKKAFVSLLTLTAPDSWGFLKGSSLYGGIDIGQGINSYGPTSPGAPFTGSHNKTEWYVGATVNTPVKDLTFGASYDGIEHNDVYASVNNAGVITSGVLDSGYFAAYSGYVSYKITDKLTINGRGEYATGDGLAAAESANSAIVAGSPLFDKALAITGTLQYDLWANVISRLEVRWDHACDRSTPFGATDVNTGTGSKRNDVMVAANVIYKF